MNINLNMRHDRYYKYHTTKYNSMFLKYQCIIDDDRLIIMTKKDKNLDLPEEGHAQRFGDDTHA